MTLPSTHDLNASYSGRRAVVVGAGGFIGIHLVRRLTAAGADVVSVLREGSVVPTPLGKTTIAFADACSRDAMLAIVRGGDVVFQLAGRAGAIASMLDPVADMKANCGSMLALLDAAAAREPRPHIVFTGSRLQYGRVDGLPVDEMDPKRPTSPYGLHKTLCEDYLAYYHRQFGVSYAVARLTNPYGGAHVDVTKSYNILNQIVARAVAGATINVYGDGVQVRDYIHIDDVVDALLLLGRFTGTTTVNIGSGTGMTFRAAVEYIVAHSAGAVKSVPWPPNALAVETGGFIANIDRARALGFAPAISFAEGIDRTIAECMRIAPLAAA